LKVLSRERYHRCHFHCKAKAGEVLVAKEGAFGCNFFGCHFVKKSFDRIPRASLWRVWYVRYVKFEEGIVDVVRSMYTLE